MKKPQSLVGIIAHDLLVTNWLLALLVIAIAATSIAVTWSAQKNRDLNAQLARLLNEQIAVESKWRKLRLEHRALAEHSRIEQLAREQLKMIPVTAKKETVLK